MRGEGVYEHCVCVVQVGLIVEICMFSMNACEVSGVSGRVYCMFALNKNPEVETYLLWQYCR
jgi:hypothetical protein